MPRIRNFKPAVFLHFRFAADSYNLVPVIAWTAPSGEVGLTDGSGNITLDLSVSDANGDLVGLRVDSVKSDGTAETTHDNLSFGATTARDWAKAVTFAAGVYLLTVTATDRAGNVAVSTRTIQFVSGGTLEVPDHSPAFGEPIGDSLSVTVTEASGCGRIEWVVDVIGSAAPSGSGTAELSPPKVFTVTTPCRIWARSGDGATWSEWVFADYE